MRLQIKGEITQERLEKALAAAREQFRQSGVDDVRFFGANLYLIAYDANGLPVEAVDHTGKEIMLSFAPEPGTPAKPPVTQQGVEQQAARVADAALREQRMQALIDANADLRKQQYDRWDAGLADSDAIDGVSDCLLLIDGPGFIAEMNDCLARAWAMYPPTDKGGGTSGLVPTFGLDGGKLHICYATWKKGRRVKSPLAQTFHFGRYRSEIWRHAAWEQAFRMMAAAMAARIRGLSPEGVLTADDLRKLEPVCCLLDSFAVGGTEAASMPYIQEERRIDQEIRRLNDVFRAEEQAMTGGVAAPRWQRSGRRKRYRDAC